MAIEFSVELKELKLALKYLFAPNVPKKYARSQFVDVNARESEVQLVTTGAELVLPAQVTHRGYGRVPYMAVDWLRKAIRSLSRSPVRCIVEPGRIRVASLSFTSPEVTIRPIGARIADIPAEAALPDVLALLLKYHPEELEDSGLLTRVLAAQEQTSRLMDQALTVMGPLEIPRQVLGRFIWTQVKRRAGKAMRGPLDRQRQKEVIKHWIDCWRSVWNREGEQAARDMCFGQKLSVTGKSSLDLQTRRALLMGYRRAETKVFGSIQEVPGERETLGISSTPVECWQWRRYARGNQRFGNRTAIYELNEILFESFIKPKLESGYAETLADYQARHPGQKYLSLTQVGGEGPEHFTGSGFLEELRPQGGLLESARRVSSFDSSEAKEWGALCDPEREPLNIEEWLMRDLGFKHLRDLEHWLNQPVPTELLERFGDDEDLLEDEDL